MENPNAGAAIISKIFFDKNETVEQYIKNTTTNNWYSNVKITKFTIDGKNAFNITFNGYENSTQYETLIDLGNNMILKISPVVHSGVKDQTQTESYKAYSYIVNTIKINS